MMHPHVRRLSVIAVLAALVVTATPAPLLAQGAGGVGQDGSGPGQSVPSPSSPGVSVTHHMTVEPGIELAGQGDIPPGERLHTPDKVTFWASVSGTGGGPTAGGGQCTPTTADLHTDLILPGVAPQMDPPAPFPGGGGGLGGVVTMPTWFWATFTSDSHPTSSASGHYTTCSRSTDALGRTFWSANDQLASIRLSSAPLDYFWDFGDANASCGDPGAGTPNSMGDPERPTIQHNYCVSSIRGLHDTGYPVYFRVDFTTLASINTGGADQEADTMTTRSYTIVRYPVREVQAVLDE